MKYNQEIQEKKLFNQLLSDGECVQTIDDFKRWTRESIRTVFPHETLGCIYGRIHAGGVGIDEIVAVDFPIEHFKSIRNKAGGYETPIFRRWLDKRQPQLFDVASPWPGIPSHWLEQFQKHQLKNAAAHAVYDEARCVVTYHSFHRIPGTLNDVHAETLKLLTPIMHEVLCRVFDGLHAGDEDIFGENLSSRERDVLERVGQGKSNLEIANAFTLSETTVKHHLANIFKKLNVNSRGQLVRLWVEHELRMKNRRELNVR